MPVVARIRLWFRALTASRNVERELDREVRLHLELETEHNMRSGMEPAEAARRAKVAFGGVQRFKEAVSDERGVR
ncbi:MAG: permease prefix domain 1-containing protein, partial [Gemmatimonadaceae bacterium]